MSWQNDCVTFGVKNLQCMIVNKKVMGKKQSISFTETQLIEVVKNFSGRQIRIYFK